MNGAVGPRAAGQEVVPVGFESELAYRLLPFVPGPVKGLVTRTPLHRLVV